MYIYINKYIYIFISSAYFMLIFCLVCVYGPPILCGRIFGNCFLSFAKICENATFNSTYYLL